MRRSFAMSLVALVMAAGLAAQEAGVELEDLEELYAWGAVSSVVEVDEEGDGKLLGFHFHTDEGETFEVVMDDRGRALAKEASDRTDVVVELEGRLSVDRLMVTVTDFRIVVVDPEDEEVEESEESEPATTGDG
jgi:hypothetical protein